MKAPPQTISKRRSWGADPSSIGSWLLWLSLGLAFIVSGCQTFEPKVFDDRLREATFESLLEAIEDCYGDQGPIHERVRDLEDSFRAQALDAKSESEFYAILAELLNALGDPHVSARWSPQHSSRPEARPYRFVFRRMKDGVYVSYPKGYERLPRFGGLSLDQIDNLRALSESSPSAWIFGPEVLPALLESFDDSPRVWRKLISIEGIAVRHSSTLELLIHGPLMSMVRLEVEHPERGRSEVYLLRNCMRGEDFGLNAAVMNPSQYQASVRDSLWWTSASGTTPLQSMAWARSDIITIPGHSSWVNRAFHARQINDLGYLRIATFVLGKDEDRNEIKLLNAIREDLDNLFWQMRDLKGLIIDLRGNPGGWGLGMVAVASYFLNDQPYVPFVARYTEPRSFLGIPFEIEYRIRLPRDPVDPLPVIPVTVLVDQNTASAAEVLSSILRSKRGAALVGETTRGAEYMVRELILPDGSEITLGTGGGMVNGCEGFQGVGLQPDFPVELSLEEVERFGLEGAKLLQDARIMKSALNALGKDPRRYIEIPKVWERPPLPNKEPRKKRSGKRRVI